MTGSEREQPVCTTCMYEIVKEQIKLIKHVLQVSVL